MNAEELPQVAAEILEAERYIEEAVKRALHCAKPGINSTIKSLQSKSKNGS